MKTAKGWLLNRKGVWHVVWQADGSKHSKSTGTSDRRTAEKRLAEIMAPVQAQGDVAALREALDDANDREANAVTGDLEGVWRDFCRSQARPDCSPQTLAGYKAQWLRFKTWITNNRPSFAKLREIDRKVASEYAENLQASVSPSTFNRHRGLLALVWRVLADSYRLGPSPWLSVRRLRAVQLHRRALTLPELQAVLAACTPSLRPLFMLGAYSGMRLGDCACLKWESVDLSSGRISLVPSKGRALGKVVVIPLHPSLSSVLAGLPAGKSSVFPNIARLYRKDRSGLCKSIQAVFDKAGVTTVGEKPDGRLRASCAVGFHSLRHTFVSLCRAADAPLSVVESIVGHSNPQMTREYTHTGLAEAQRAINAIPAIGEEKKKDTPKCRCPKCGWEW